MIGTIPISDVIPLAPWIQAYHHFRVRLDLRLYQSGLSLLDLHRNQLGPETRPGVWETSEYRIFIEGRALSFEIPEDSSIKAAFAAFDLYQKKLFGD